MLVAAVLAAPASAAPGPVAAYSMDQGAGGSLPDVTGTGNNGTIAGATWITGGRFGGALNFNGASHMVSVPDSPSLDLTTGMTQEAWVRPSALGGDWRTVLLKERPGGLVYSLYAHGTDSTNVPMTEITIVGAATVAGTSTLPLGVWTHIASTYDGATMRFFVNGVQVAQRAQTGSIVASTGPLRIGANSIWREAFVGDIDEVRVYNRALTAAELQGDMNQPVGVVDGEPPTAPSNLTATGSLANAQLSWTAAADNVSVARYNVHRGTTPGFTPTAANRIAQPTGTSFTDTPAAGTYYYKVTAEDGSGNVGPASNEASAQVGDLQAPSAPGTLSATGAIGRATLNWGAASDNVGVVRYNVHRSTTAGFTPSAANRIAQPTGTNLTDTVAAGTYFYKVTAEDAAGNVGPAGNEASAVVTVDTQAPSVPANLAANAAGQTVNLSWSPSSDNAGVTRYNVHRSTSSGFTPSTANRIGQPGSTSYADGGLPAGTYFYKVTAEDAAGNVSGASNQASATVTVTAPTGLVAAYGFDEGAGTTTADQSGNGNGGSLSNTVWSTAGKFNNALSFNGSARVNVNDSASLRLTNGMTLEAWVRPSALGDWRTVVLKERTGWYAYALYANTDSGRPSGHVFTTGDHDLRGTGSLPVNAWTHLAATYNGSVLALYVNGTQVSSQPATGAIIANTGPLRIGGNAIWGEHYVGLIDEVRVYNRALSATEIQGDMDRSVTVDVTPPTVTNRTPGAGAAGVHVGSSVTATFSEAMRASTITPSAFTLETAQGASVPATVTYDSPTNTATLRPQGALGYGVTYRATVRAGAATDLSGNPLTGDVTWTFSTEASPPQVLVVGATGNPFASYLGEILRNEGLDAFTTLDVSLITPALLDEFDVVLLGQTPLNASQVSAFTNWVNAGGNLIAMRPDKQLAALLGLTDAGTTLSNTYLRVDATQPPGAGIVSSTIQFHGAADRYNLNGARAVATLFSNATTATTSPAVTLRSVGSSGGEAAAFTYDLARSVVYTRQGNPAWAGQKRDGWAPLSIRPDDLFYGAKAGDVQPDWVDPNRFDVPQADEQQRLFANLITQMNLDKAPLPRFWYLPSGDKAAIVLTGDDHGTGHTTEYFNRLKAASPAGCSVADWQCVRATSYVYPETPLTQAQANSFVNDGFEIALHVNTGCLDYTPASIEDTYTSQLGAFAATWPDLPKPVTNRTHCIVWSDWASQAKTERHHGIRFDTNYYYKGPPEWVKKPGLMTGSGFPQRFADSDGSMIDVYQAMTQVSDEEETVLPTATQVHTLLDNALGPKNYWGAFTVILHTDNGDHAQLNQLVGDAQNRGVPVVSSAQMLQWLDGRNGSSFGNVAYSGGQLTFTLSAQASARDLQAMLPARSASGPLSKLKRNGAAISWTRKTIKGVDYVMFDAASGSYTATYANDTTAPEITNVSATADAEGHATVKWTTDEPSTSLVQYGRTTSLGYEKEQTAEVTDHSVELTGLVPATTYRFNVSSTDTAGNTGTSPATPGSFSTPASALVDSRRSEFAAGTTSGTWAGDTLTGPDGEVQLQPTVGDEFDGPGLSSQWVATPWQLGGTTNVVGGTLVADTAVVHTPAYYAGPRTLEFSATFQAVNDQAVGLGNDLSDFPYAIFTSGMPGETPGVYAQSGGGPGNEIESPLPNVSLYVPHRFRIEWTPTVIRYYVDGALVATHNVAIENELRPVLSDYGLFGASVKVDWMRMSTYPTSGTFTSRPLDSGPGANDWQTLSWQTATLPTGTSVSFETRSGGARTPDNKWSAWQPLGLGNAIASPNARYLQYRATLQGPGTATPTLQKVQATYGAGTDRAPNTGTVSLAPTAPKTNQVVTATAGSFTDPDGDPVTLHYDWFRNGTQIPGASASSLNLALAGNGDRGDKIRVEVYGTDNKGAASDVASAKVTVADTAPTAGTVTTKPVPAATKDILRALPSGFADIDADTLTYQYQWLINGTPVAGATNATFNVSGLVKLNDRVDVDVKAIDGFGGTSPTVRGGQVITTTNSTPVDGTVAITPASPKTNQLVTVQTSGFSDADGDALTYHYVWSRNGTAIPGATASTLDLSQAGNGDRGDTIKVSVNVTDPAGHASDGVSATATVATTDPTAGTVTVRPTAPAADDTVSAVPTGYADIDGDALSYQYQWFRNGTAISGATGRSLNLATVPGVAAGDVLKVQARALDGHGGTSPFAEGTTAVAAGNGHPVASFGFEEASGNVATDQWGGNDGTITGATRTNAGRFGRALSFENDGDLVTVPEDTSLHLGSGMTLEAWVKPTATTNWRSVIFKEADGGLAYGLYANSDQDVPHVHIGNQGDFGVDGPSELDPNKWTHLAATFDGNILKLYEDGVQVGSKAISGELSDAPGPLTIGGNNIWGEHFRGTIDEVRVYNRALSREDVGSDMTAPVTPGTPAPPADNNPDAIGTFSKPVDYPITPVHLALLSDGRVAMWDGFEAALNSEHTWDPWSGQFDAIPTGRNLFCAGHVTLPDGRLLVAGGHVQAYEGTKDTNLFNPQTNTWFRGADMQNARWYPTSTTLPDGRVFTISGDNITLGPNPDPNTPVPLINYSDTLPEIYNPTTNAWTSMPSASRRMPLYPFMFVLPNGKLFDAGPDKVTRTLDLGTGQWTTVGNSPIDGQSAVMYRPGKILKSGTWSDPEFPDRDASNKTAMIDMTAASPAWTEAAPMKYRRSFNTLTVLPDGKVLTTGGQTKTDGVDETTGVLPAEMWDPSTNTWTTMASSHRPRLYHSSAVLLPDGRVLLAGGGAYGTAHNEKSGELYSPPYMFKGPRPTITDGPAAVHYGQSFTIDTPDASRISKVTLVHMGTVTHNFDMDQRYMELNATAGSGQLTVSGPQNANVAPPGWYMVFLVDSNGVPSYAQIVMVDAAGDTQAPTAPSTLSATAVTDGANLSWSASSDNVGVTGYRVYRSTTAGFTPGPSNRIATVKSGTTYQDRGVAAGTYRYRVKAVDKAGNLSAASPQATATVTGDTTAPSVSLSAPAAGASLSNTVAVSATAADNVGVQSVQFKLDGQDLGAADITSPYSISWDTKTATDGPHALTAVARDASGNTKTSASVAVEVHNTGLVAAYGFEEASGATAVDALGHRNGTIVGGATRTVSGRFGQALTLDGASGMVTVPDDSTLRLSSGMTLEAWVRPSALTSASSILTKDQTGGFSYSLLANTAANVPSANVFTTSALAAAGPASLALGTWTHVAETWDGANVKLFIDGAEVASQPTTGSLAANAGQLKIGGSSTAGQFFNGLVDEVRVFSRARTASEIEADMNAPVSP